MVDAHSAPGTKDAMERATTVGDDASIAAAQAGTPGSCAIALSRDDGKVVALLTGDLETNTSWDVERVLDEELRTRPDLLEVSLEGLDFMDSSGLRMFLLLQRNAERLGVPVRFTRPRGAVRRTLEFAKALDYLGIDD